MKIMVLNVTFNGYYGGNVNEILILPLELNGVLFEELVEGTYTRVVYLGEIEGKHSECYGDLHVEFLDLDDLSVKEITNLISSSSFGEFESFFEGEEADFQENEEEYDEGKVEEILSSYGVEVVNWMIQTSAIHDKFIDILKEKHVQNLRTITVLETDYNSSIKLLVENNINIFE